MSDFRVRLGTTPEGGERELDWDSDHRNWSLSEREPGEAWVEHLTPTHGDWQLLRQFFQVPDELADSVLRGLSPGELVAVHTVASRERRVVAELCDQCGSHWVIYRFDQDRNTWRRFGRTCSFTWFKGEPVEQADVPRGGKVVNPQ
jgi:hypothetical protein